MTETTVHAGYRITDLQASERPRERLAALGAQALSNAELIAILLRVGVTGENAVQVGQRILTKYKGIRGLHRVPFVELCKEHGIAEAKACQIKAAIEKLFGKKVADVNTSNYDGKKKRQRTANFGRTAHWKKAIVTLKKGEKIDLA